jgi:hypothetical protein
VKPERRSGNRDVLNLDKLEEMAISKALQKERPECEPGREGIRD